MTETVKELTELARHGARFPTASQLNPQHKAFLVTNLRLTSAAD